MERKKKVSGKKCLTLILSLLFCVSCGLLIGFSIGTAAKTAQTPRQKQLFILGLLITLYISVFAQIVIHEAGHLIFGLLSGYRFSSFRILNLMWVKEEGRLRLRRLSIAGTAGQCLMSPPDLKDGKFPVLLYNLGGPLINLISAVLFILLHFVFAGIPFLSAAMLLLALIGIIFAALNGIPITTEAVSNDGANALSLTKDPDAQFAFWVQMKINDQISQGTRLKDMSDEWFRVPSDEQMNNSMTACMGVFACNRLIDAHRFDEARELMLHLMEIKSAIAGLHRNLMTCDLLYLELMNENRPERIDAMLTKEQKKFMKSMKTFPSVLRTEYVLALLGQKDQKKALKIKALFEKHAKKYPYPNDVQSERELMELAEAK